MKEKNTIKLHKKVKRFCVDYIIHGIGDPTQVYQNVIDSTSIIGRITGINSYTNFDFNIINHTQIIPVIINLNSSKSKKYTPPQKRAKDLIQYFQTQLNSGGGN